MIQEPNFTKTTLETLSTIMPVHPGQYVREKILNPRKMSVTAAAKLVGVGRPAFSNFINGHVQTTSGMASRIEQVFGFPAQELLDMQAKYDATTTKLNGTLFNTIPYVPPFLDFKSTHIENWASRNISARSRLSVFLRTLVNSTNSYLKKVDFPGNDDAQRSGWDGFIEATQASQWVPEGLSGWEFGTNQEITSKANHDFSKDVEVVSKDHREKITFIFVTPRHWPGKTAWIKTQKTKNEWKNVRAYDSSDLEQWLEQSIAGQTWFANETHILSKGVRTLEKCWTDWADVVSPSLSGELFRSAIENAKQIILSRLSNQPYEPTVIAADSADEALAFLAQLFGGAGGEELAKYRDHILVFDEPGVLPILAQGTKDFIAIASNNVVAKEMGPLTHSIKTIIVSPRNSTNTNLHIILEPLNYKDFHTALKDMGYADDEILKYEKETGRSLTVLRRRLSNVSVVRTPSWASDHETAVSLIPFLFMGVWNSANETDKEILVRLAMSDPYETLERKCQFLTGLDDPPLWSIGTYRGVISKIDLLFAINPMITTEDLKRYFDTARLVLGEEDPKLDLPEGERWAAIIHGKTRKFSTALRKSISETLVLLAVYGNRLFQSRLGINCEQTATQLVHELLTPLKARILEANDSDLTAYAEAAPDEFLNILEEDLQALQPETYGLMRPASTDVFGANCPRSGLLWALESLAWNPDTLLRVVLILAQLSEIEINDNWANKPIHSLESIFRVWMPQTAADHTTRLKVIQLLADKYPKIAWKIFIMQLDTGTTTGTYNHKPIWRNDAYGVGEPFRTSEPIVTFLQEIIKMVLNWKNGYTREMLCDLIMHLHDLSSEYQAKVWAIVKSWAEGEVSDSDKAFVREKIRTTVLSFRGVKRSMQKESPAISAVARIVYQALEPQNLLDKYEWLFKEYWVEESADELEEKDMDIQKRDERISKIRTDALHEVYSILGLHGITELAKRGRVAPLIGRLLADRILKEEELPVFFSHVVSHTAQSDILTNKNLVYGALHAIGDDKKRESILKKTFMAMPQTDQVQLLLLAPFRRSTWQTVDALNEVNRSMYWQEVSPEWIHESDEESNEAIDRLLVAKRPRAAFTSVCYKLEAIKPESLFRLLSEMVKDSNDQPGDYQLEEHHIQKAFFLMDKSLELSIDKKAGLEFAYIDALLHSWRKHEDFGIPNLEKYVETHPELFVQAIVWTYKRHNEGEDPIEWKVDPLNIQRLAEHGYKFLNSLSSIPGHDSSGTLNTNLLTAWVNFVRHTCIELDRQDVADFCLGKLFSNAPAGIDSIWPCEPVREVMEAVKSKHMMEGAFSGLYNSRGVVFHKEGGDQERELAEKYHTWAKAMNSSHPFIASRLLGAMVRTYEHEADREDTEAKIMKRLR